jgi:hypothetical protein
LKVKDDELKAKDDELEKELAEMVPSQITRSFDIAAKADRGPRGVYQGNGTT